MTTDQPEPPTRAQLHERACICCGREDTELVPADHYPMSTGADSAPLGWAIVKCADQCQAAWEVG